MLSGSIGEQTAVPFYQHTHTFLPFLFHLLHQFLQAYSRSLATEQETNTLHVNTLCDCGGTGAAHETGFLGSRNGDYFLVCHQHDAVIQQRGIIWLLEIAAMHLLNVSCFVAICNPFLRVHPPLRFSTYV